MDSVFLDLESNGGTDYLGLGDASGADLAGNGGTVVDLRALAKDRQKKDNHNMSMDLSFFCFFFFSHLISCVNSGAD